MICARASVLLGEASRGEVKLSASEIAYSGVIMASFRVYG